MQVMSTQTTYSGLDYERVTCGRGMDGWPVSVIHQNKGGIGKSIPDEFPNPSRVLVEYGQRTFYHHSFNREWFRKSYPVGVLGSIPRVV